jgi:hypothetical protein
VIISHLRFYDEVSYKAITKFFVNYKKGALDSQLQVIKVYQLLAHGRWFSLGTPASSTTKAGRHDIAEILLKAHVGSRSNTDPTYDYSTMGTTQKKDSNNMYDHVMESMDATCSNI